MALTLKLALIEYNDAIKSEKTIEDGKLVVVQKTAIEVFGEFARLNFPGNHWTKFETS